MYLQPKFSISKNKIVGAEALVRILDDHSNIIPPAQIIPVLESTGVIDTLDNIMIEKVFELQRRWINEGREVFTISVNVSRQRFTKGDFTDMAIALQKKYNIPPFLIEFEIVESVFIENTDTIVNTSKSAVMTKPSFSNFIVGSSLGCTYFYTLLSRTNIRHSSDLLFYNQK